MQRIAANSLLRGIGVLGLLLLISWGLYQVRPLVFRLTGEATLLPILPAGYFFGLVPALYVIILLRRRLGVANREICLLLLVPLLSYCLVLLSVGRSGSLANIFLEPILLGLTVGAVQLVGLYAVARGRRSPRVQLLTLAFATLAAVAFATLFPVLAE